MLLGLLIQFQNWLYQFHKLFVSFMKRFKTEQNDGKQYNENSSVRKDPYIVMW